jgi:hypothetical protein
MTEETRNAGTSQSRSTWITLDIRVSLAMSGPRGIVMSIGVSALLGWFLIIGLLFSIQDYEATVTSATGQPITQILLDTVGERGAIALMVRMVTIW